MLSTTIYNLCVLAQKTIEKPTVVAYNVGKKESEHFSWLCTERAKERQKGTFYIFKDRLYSGDKKPL